MNKPIDLTSNQILIIKSQLYFYDVSQDTIKLVMEDDNVGLAVASPSQKYLAITKGQHGEVLIFNSKMGVLTKASQGVIEVLDLKGEHFIYQYPNERSFSEEEKPAIYLDDQKIFQGSAPSSLIGEILSQYK